MKTLVLFLKANYKDRPGYWLGLGPHGKRRWMRIAFGQRAGLFGLPPIPVTPLDGEPFADGKAALQWALSNLRGSYRNQDTGWTVHVARVGLEKALSKSKRLDATHFKAIRHLPELLQRAVLAETYPDRALDPNIKAIHRLYAPAHLGEMDYRVKLTVKEYADGRRFYDQSLTEIENPAQGGASRKTAAVWLGHAPSISGVASTTRSAASEVSITDLLRGATRAHAGAVTDGRFSAKGWFNILNDRVGALIAFDTPSRSEACLRVEASKPRSRRTPHPTGLRYFCARARLMAGSAHWIQHPQGETCARSPRAVSTLPAALRGDSCVEAILGEI